MSTLGIRLSDDLDERLSEESRLMGQPKSLLVRTALEQFLAGRRRERLLACLSAAAAATDIDATAIAAEALAFDNESLALAESVPDISLVSSTRSLPGQPRIDSPLASNHARKV